MAGALVGGAFLSASLQVLFDRLASRDLIDFFWRKKLDGALLNKLKITLLAVNAVLNDAEEKQMTNPSVKAWLDELKDATYDAEDLLDEIATEASRCELKFESQTKTNKVLKYFICTSVISFDEGINSKIKGILVKLEFIANQKISLGLKEVAGEKSPQKLPTTSLLDEFVVYGRDDDREQIIKLLLSDDASGNKIGVITIVGMGGVGKTTLTQLVYNDDEVEKHFDSKAWVCVSEEFDVLRVTKTIVEAVNSSPCDIKDLNTLQVKLKEGLTGKKFLLILDDVWNENYVHWGDLQKPFRSGARGSKIIVTTRIEGVASIMHTVPTHHLKHLQDEDCWMLFEKHAFNNGNSSVHPNLEVIGREIVRKCKGLPLAVKTLGGLLRSKEDVKEWNKILKSDLWDLPNDKNSILPALRLSYHYLPSQLKRCFAYCSIFPKDYRFKKQQLVLLWMAEDLLQHSNRNKRLEEVGDENFDDLVSRSIFQRLDGDEFHFVMHDLINDLAQFVSGEFSFRLEGDSTLHEIPEKTRHLSYFGTGYDAFKKVEAFYHAKGLRTFLSLSGMCGFTEKVLHDLLPTLSCLRVLSLFPSYNISELPESIGSLKHLRYVDLSHTAIRRLPKSTSTLFNLQTLMLSGCYCLTALPIDMWRLVNLCHLDVSGTDLKEMPKHMSRLTSLQTLSTFIVGKHSGSMITELRESQHLRGALHIRNLQNVVKAKDALEVNLKDNEYLDKLVLEWNIVTEDSKNERDVLDKLQPHANLKGLTIKGYSGTRFPNWLGDRSFCNMVYLHLSYCKYCFSLPPLGQLSCLKDLSIVGFDGVERVGPEFYGNGSFGSLEILRFVEMSEWVEWSCFGNQGGEFPRLRELYIENCPKLNGGLPDHLPSLTKLRISESLVVSLPRAPAIRELKVENCAKGFLRSNDELTSHPSSHVPYCHTSIDFGRLPSIEISKVSGISQLKELLPQLHRLIIRRCDNLESLPEGLIQIIVLEIFDCPSLNSFPEGGPPDTLNRLCIVNCKNLESLPKGMRHINYLEISNCPSLKYSFPKDGGLPATLKTLLITECRELELFPPEKTMHNYCASLEFVELRRSCDSLKSFPLGLFPKLNKLFIEDCKNLESLWIPEGRHEDLTSLSELQIWSCPKLVSFPKGGFPTPNLLSLSIINCNKLTAGLMEWGLQRLASLKTIGIRGCEEVESFSEEWLLPSTLTSLSIWNFPNLKYLDKRGLQHLNSLERLMIWGCPKLQFLPEEPAGWMEWGLQRLASLKTFRIKGCEEVESFPEEWLLPSTLTSLTIMEFPNLKYLDKRGLQHLTSLERLMIWGCPKLQFLPEEGLPASISSLDIQGSPLLEQRCQREKGEDWPKITHIPRIRIN